jgi:APA family basic amino acid/polyamine antiporter
MLRKKTAHLNDSGIFIMKLYPLLPIIFIMAYTFVAINLLVTETKLSLVGIGVLTAFIAIYFIMQKFKKQVNYERPQQ